MKQFNILLCFWVFVLFSLVSCKKDPPPDDNDIETAGRHGVFIVNEGNFQWSNASVTYYNFTDGDYKEDVFKDVNGRPLGDVAQSISVFNGKAYIVVNNSNKVEVVNLSDFNSCGVISGLVSPRYFIPVSVSKAYVSDLYSNYISIVDLNNNLVTGTIACKGSSEEMLLYNDMMIVTNTRTDKIYLINTVSDVISDSIPVGFASNSLQLDKNGRLWVMCAGDAVNNVNASLYRIDLSMKQVEQTFQLDTPLDIWDKMAMNNAKDSIYYMCHGIYRMAVNAPELPGNVFIPQGTALFHAVAVNPVNNNIFVADAIDYVQKGKVYYYSPAGVLLGTINTGIIPADFYFF